jgi:hypothetical protein
MPKQADRELLVPPRRVELAAVVVDLLGREFFSGYTPVP